MAQRLIDANELREVFEMMGWKDVVAITDGQPTINLAEYGYVPLGLYEQIKWERDVAMQQLASYGVGFGEKADVQKVKHGKWIPCENGGYYCSNCDRRVAFLVHNNYCPNCGARMDGE